MGLFGKDYDTEIIELQKKTSVLTTETTDLRVDTDNNKLEIISIANDFGNYKLETQDIINGLLEEQKNLLKRCSELEITLKNIEHDKNQEIEIKKETSDILTCDDICSEITDVKYLQPTSFKYYLYELGLLNLNINKRLNTYKAVSNYKEVCTEVSQYMYVKGRVITFDKDVMGYFKEHLDDLRNSINRYMRKMDQFTKSKNNIDALKVKNYQAEIGNICGTRDSFDKNKWSKIYKVYKKNHPNFWNEHAKYVEEYMQEHPHDKKPSMITYLVQQCGDGDVLLKIACELFVD